MKKSLLFLILLSFAFMDVYAQTPYWNTTGNALTNSTQFIGTTDFNPLIFKTNGLERMQLLPNKAFLGIGVSNPQATLHLFYPAGLEINQKLLQLTTSTSPNGFSVFSNKNTKDIIFFQQEQSKFFLEGPGGGFVIAKDGNLGFGTDEPTEKIHLEGKLLIERTANTQSSLQFKHPNNTKDINQPPNSYTSYYWDIYSDIEGLKFNTISSPNTNPPKPVQRVVITSNGSVGIGVANPKAKLSVAGTVQADNAEIYGRVFAYELSVEGLMCAKEVRVMLSGSPCWPDYVFSKNYKLMPLQELEQFVNKNQHLPNVPSATSVAENGVELGEMNATLLKKVEELTLYIIDLQKQIDELKNSKP